MPQPISMAKIEEMFSAYADTPSAAHVSRVCGIDKRTAQKYIAEGDPARGVEPFVQRVRRVTRLAARRVEKKIAYRKADAHAAAWEHLQLLDDCIIEAALDIRENMADRKPKIHELAKAVQVSVMLKTQLKKWAEDDGGQNDAEEFFADWTEEQVEFFIEHGQVPDDRPSSVIDVESETVEHEQGERAIHGASRDGGEPALQSPPAGPEDPDGEAPGEEPAPEPPDGGEPPPETPPQRPRKAPSRARKPRAGTTPPPEAPGDPVPDWLDPEE